MFLISSCSRGEIFAAGTGHSETWSGQRNQFSPVPEGKTLAVPQRSGVRAQVFEIQDNVGLEFIQIRGERLGLVWNLSFEMFIALAIQSDGSFGAPEESIQNDYDMSNHPNNKQTPTAW